MAVEAKRGCGFRKVGGIYLVGGGPGVSCHRLPMNMHVCPTCSQGIKFTRGFSWIVPTKLFGMCPETGTQHGCHKINCRCCNPPGDRHGLLWVGKGFYTPETFTAEATLMGVSKRIAAIPRGFEIGETWIYLAHNEAGTETSVGPGGAIITKKVPAVFYLFKPQRIEKIITKSQSENEAEMQKLTELGITPVIVPDNDPDHQGSVHDKDE